MWRLKIFAKVNRWPLKAWVSLAGIGLIAITIIGIALITVAPLRITRTVPNLSNNRLSLTAGVKIYFSHPVSRRQLDITINPPIEGEWIWEKSWLGNHFASTATFVPTGLWPENLLYTIHFHQVADSSKTNSQSDQEISFQTQALPQAISASVTNGQSGVNENEPITVSLDQPNDNLVRFAFRFDPEVDFSTKLNPDQKSYTLTPKTGFNQGQSYHLYVDKQIIGSDDTPPGYIENALNVAFTTHLPPGILSYSPQGSSVLATTSEFKVVFKDPMNQPEVLANLSLTPALKGTWQWIDDKTIIFQPSEKLALATTYVIKLGAGVHTTNGSVTNSDISVTFSTIGRVKVANVRPANRAAGQAVKTAIRIMFDQDVDHLSAESRYLIEPKIDGNFSWNQNQMSWQPAVDLAYSSTYHVTVQPGVKSVNGLDSEQVFTSQFTTEEQSIVLNIPWDHQDKALSCEVASLKMALRYKGAQVSEDDIMAVVGYDPTIRDGSVWGDPNQAFVGNINGSQNTTGYGVYWGPIARAARTWRNAEAFSGWTISRLAASLANGNPVVIWGTLGRAYSESWQTPSGNVIQAWKGEHTRTVIGFKGSIDNPTSFIVNDPIVGRLTWSTSQLQANWSSFGNSGVVVY